MRNPPLRTLALVSLALSLIANTCPLLYADDPAVISALKAKGGEITHNGTSELSMRNQFRAWKEFMA